MTVSLTLPPDVEARVHQEAAKRSLAVEVYVAEVVTASVPTAAETETERRARVVAVIESISEMGTEEEQRETFEYSAQAIDADRLSERKR